MSALERVRGRHRGGTCAIIANGPSILEYDLDHIPCPVLTTNRAWMRKWPDYHVCLEADHYLEAPGVYRELARENRLFVLGSTWPHDVGIHMPVFVGDRKQERLSFDLTRGVIEGWGSSGTVAYAALQVAIWLGFVRVFYVGLDLRGKTKFTGHSVGNLEGQVDLFVAAAPLLRERGIEVKVVGQASRAYCFERISWPWG
jgi:hypothetical protein